NTRSWLARCRRDARIHPSGGWRLTGRAARYPRGRLLVQQRTPYSGGRAIDLGGFLDAAYCDAAGGAWPVGDAAKHGQQRDGVDDHPSPIAFADVRQQVAGRAARADNGDEGQDPLRQIAGGAQVLGVIADQYALEYIYRPHVRLGVVG